MNRKKARELVMSMIFQTDVNGDEDPSEYLEKAEVSKDQEEYVRKAITEWNSHRDEIDSIIEKHAIGWKIARMPRTDIAVLREACTEIMYMPDIPVAVSINEAVELAKRFGTEDSPKFINAVLGKIAVEKDEF